MGCTPDFISVDGTFIVQTKCVDGLEFKRKWAAEGDVITEAPMHVLLQVQHELACNGLSRAWLVALVGGNPLLRRIVEARPKTQEKLCGKVIVFGQSIKDGPEPDPDFIEDGDAIAALFAEGTTAGSSYSTHRLSPTRTGRAGPPSASNVTKPALAILSALLLVAGAEAALAVLLDRGATRSRRRTGQGCTTPQRR